MKKIVRGVSSTLPMFWIVFLLFPSPSLSEETKSPSFSVRVQLDVMADESLAPDLSHGIGEKLRLRGDVVLTETNLDYQLTVVAQPLKSKTGDLLGVIYSMEVTQPLNFETSVKPILEKKLSSEDLTRLKSMTLKESQHRGTWVAFAPGSDLKESGETTVTDVVARFDKEILTPAGKAYRRASDALKRLDLKSGISKDRSSRSGRKSFQRGGGEGSSSFSPWRTSTDQPSNRLDNLNSTRILIRTSRFKVAVFTTHFFGAPSVVPAPYLLYL